MRSHQLSPNQLFSNPLAATHGIDGDIQDLPLTRRRLARNEKASHETLILGNQAIEIQRIPAGCRGRLLLDLAQAIQIGDRSRADHCAVTRRIHTPISGSAAIPKQTAAKPA